MKNKLIGLFFLLTVFSMMCVLRWWFTVYLIFSTALLMTVVFKKRNYCHNVCPIAFVQGITYSKDSKTMDLSDKMKKFLRRAIMAVFWVALIGLTLYYFWTGNLPLLWHRLLILMLSSLSTAVLLQEAYGKRIWCKFFCPFGAVLDRVVKLLR